MKLIFSKNLHTVLQPKSSEVISFYTGIINTTSIVTGTSSGIYPIKGASEGGSTVNGVLSTPSIYGESNASANLLGTLVGLVEINSDCFIRIKYPKKEYIVRYFCGQLKRDNIMKTKISRVHNDQSDLNFVIHFPQGKTIADIEDIVFLVKETDSSALNSSLITKLLSQNEMTLVNKDIVKVRFDISDYDPMEIDVLYRAALFCKWKGANDFDENVERIFDFQLIQDFHNN